MTDMAARLEAMRKAVDSALDRILEDDGSGLLEAMRYAVLGPGKRFRPLLVLSAGEALGEKRTVLLPYACSLELIHAYSLVHDDLPCMDNDDYRRGQPSCHKKFGETAAVLAGDALLALAFETAIGAPRGKGGAEGKERALREIAAAAGPRALAGGQWLDLTAPREEMNEGVYFKIAGGKTAALIRAAVMAGAAVAGASADVLDAAGEYGRSLGLAFQLQDDIADAGGPGPLGELNAVTILGKDGAAARRDAELKGAAMALEMAGFASEELMFLARSVKK